MRLAIPAWNGRVSPVFEVAREIRIVDVSRGEVQATARRQIQEGRAVSAVADLGVDLLVCSAISPSLEAMLWMAGVEVVADVCGDVDEIIGAVAGGDTELVGFRTPGSLRQDRSPLAQASKPHRGGSRHRG